MIRITPTVLIIGAVVAYMLFKNSGRSNFIQLPIGGVGGRMSDAEPTNYGV